MMLSIAARSGGPLLLVTAAAAILVPCAALAAEDAGTLSAARVTEVPTLDGKGDDSAWSKAAPLKLLARRVLPPHAGAVTEAELRAVYTDTEIYLLARWRDATEDVSHKTWIWNPQSKAYEEGKDREDMFAVAFEHTGPFTADMLSGGDATWDVWHWKAFRTNPQGYAMDKTHRYFSSAPSIKAKEHKARDGSSVWIARPEDQGSSAEKARAAPADFQGERVAQYVPTTPAGSAADIRAKGVWADGWWTLELARKLDTRHDDDTAFSPPTTYRLGVAAFDRTGDMDKASGLITLRFLP